MRRGSRRCRSPRTKIREVIGTGGKVIREIVATTGAKVDIDDEGVIKISSSDLDQIEAARQWIHGIVEEPEVGKIYTGKVVNIVDFGAFVNFMGGKDGLVHVSEIRNERVENVRDVAGRRPGGEGQGARGRSARQGSPVDARRRSGDRRGAGGHPSPARSRAKAAIVARAATVVRVVMAAAGAAVTAIAVRVVMVVTWPARRRTRRRRPRRPWSASRPRAAAIDDGPAPEFAPAFLTGGNDD